MTDKLLKKHVFCFNEDANGGEALTLQTSFFEDKENEHIYCVQELSLQSYGNSASFQLVGAAITPELLRKLADELEPILETELEQI